MIGKLRGILEVIEYLDLTGWEIVHRVPEVGSGEIVLGSQCIVRENQVAIFFRVDVPPPQTLLCNPGPIRT